jgi:hypothetical protein
VAQRVSPGPQELGLELARPKRFGIRGLLAQVQARLRCAHLGSALAAGADHCASPALAVRAARLTRPRTRERLAAELDDVLAAVAQPVLGPSSAIAPDRAEVGVASPRLIGIRELLRSEAPVYAQGVAMLIQLLRDGGGPLYQPVTRGELNQSLEAITAVLEGGDTRPRP